MLMTPLMLARSWHVFSVIRNPDHEQEIQSLAAKHGRSPSNLEVLVESLEDVKNEKDAQRILDRVKPDYVVWLAGELSKVDVSQSWLDDAD